MATLSMHERGYRAGFYGREPDEADDVYLEGWRAGLRDGDRTTAQRAAAGGTLDDTSAGRTEAGEPL